MASLLVHAVIVVLLLVGIRRRQTEELLPPPSEVTMLFDHGQKQAPSVAEPTPDAHLASPGTTETPPVETSPVQPPPAETPAPPAPPVPAEPPPPPVVAEPAPAVPVEPPPPVAQSPAPSPPAAESPRPAEPAPEPAPTGETPPPRPAPEPVSPRQATPPAPRPPPRKPQPAPRPSPPAPRPSTDFPAPMNFSFGGGSAAPAERPAPAQHHPRGSIDMTLGPAARGTANSAAQDDDSDGGPDWRNALSRWVAEHAYYPEQAVRDGDEGDVKVRVLADHNGRVREVELIGKSGSMWLDLALQSMFRDARIPPLPPGNSEPIDFDFTMHYILIRR